MAAEARCVRAVVDTRTAANATHRAELFVVFARKVCAEMLRQAYVFIGFGSFVSTLDTHIFPHFDKRWRGPRNSELSKVVFHGTDRRLRLARQQGIFGKLNFHLRVPWQSVMNEEVR